MAGGSRRAARRAAERERLRSGTDDDPPRVPAGERVEDDHVVRSVGGHAGGPGAGRAYRCPGCDQLLPSGAPHVVAWPQGRPDERRHWHTACWQARDRRGVKVYRSKNAPRYG